MSETKTYEGGCHCGAVHFTAKLSLDKLIACNCSHCSVKGFLLAFGSPDAFTLDKGEDALTTYHFNTHKIDHSFCKRCGVQSFATGKTPKGQPMVMVNVHALKGVDPSQYGAITHYDGKKL